LVKSAYYYHRALMYVNGMVGISPEDTKKANEIKVAVYNNLAASQLKLNKPNRAITFSTKVLEIDQNNVKALFRRGKAYSTAGDLDRASDDLQKVEKLDPTDKAVQHELALLKQRNKKQDQKAAKFYSNMFEKLSKEPEEERSTPKVVEETTEEED